MPKRRYDTELWAQQDAPATPPAGFLALYPATDNSFHIKDPSGVDKVILSNPTGSFTINAETGSTIGLKVTAHASQAVDLIDFQTNDTTTSFLRFAGRNAGSSLAGLDVQSNSVATTGLNAGFRNVLLLNPPTASSAGYWNLCVTKTQGAQNFTDNAIGLICHGEHGSTGTISGASSSITGIAAKAFSMSGSGSVDRAIGVSTHVTANGGTITDGIGLRINNGTGTGLITNMYGIKIEDITKGGTLNYSIYTGTAPSYFGGEVTDERGSFANEALFWMS